MEVKRVETLSQYLEYINKMTQEGYLFFRGQDSYKEHKLLPSLLRENESGRKLYSTTCDKVFLNTFKSRARSYLKFVPQNDIEWMSTAQHYGLPTRLLDWSQSPLIALFFAIENTEYQYKDSEDNPVVWCLNPVALNEKLRFIDDYNIIPNIIEKNDRFDSALNEKYGIGVYLPEVIHPVALICPVSNNRINVQKGVFTLFPLNCQPLESFNDIENILFKIVIDRDSKALIKKQLFESGLTYSNIYPELDYICKDIKFEYEKNI